MKIIKQYNKFILYIIMLTIGCIVFFALGTEVPAIRADTDIYTSITTCDGVMPIYPLYSLLCKSLFGLDKAFFAMTIIQGVLSLIVTIWFAVYISKICQLSNFSTVIIYGLSLMPFVIYLPEANISQIILSESLALPLTYVMILFLVRSFAERNTKHCIIAMFIAIILYLTRSQLLTAILLVGFLLLCQLIYMGNNSIIEVIKKLGIAIVITALAFICSYKLFLGYLNQVVPYINSRMTVTSYNGNAIEIMDADEVGILHIDDDDINTTVSSASKIENSSQFSRLIMNRGMLLLQEDDYLLYSSQENQDVFKAAFSAIRANNPKGLLADNPIDWTKKWDDQGLLSEKNVDYAIQGISDYYISKDPNISDLELWEKVRADLMQFSIDAIRNHFGYFLALLLRLMLAGLQASVFFQPPSFYVICEIITIILLLLSIFILTHSRKSELASVHLFRIICCSILIYTGIVSAVHQPLQRYLMYFQGLFYVGLYVVMLEWLSKRYNLINVIGKKTKESDEKQ